MRACVVCLLFVVLVRTWRMPFLRGALCWFSLAACYAICVATPCCLQSFREDENKASHACFGSFSRQIMFGSFSPPDRQLHAFL